MKDNSLLKIGATGTVIVGLCCVTPILVILVVGVGLSSIVGYLDYVLLPALAVFVGITVYALYRRSRRTGQVNNG